jgi:hypothetical protein
MIRNIYFSKFQTILRFGILFEGNGGELNITIFEIQKTAIRSVVGGSSKMSSRQLFKEFNLLKLASL